MTDTTYISAVETAKLVRKALKNDFPGVKFSVKTSTYSGGASVRVRYTDGPRKAEVHATATQYEGGGFDGMIDMAYSLEHWLRPDGRVLLAHNPGTEGQMGSHPEQDNRDLAPVIPADAKLVRFGAKFIFVDRDISNEREQVADALTWLRAHVVVEPGERFRNYFLTDLARGMAFDRTDGETWAEVFDRDGWRGNR